MCPRNLCCGLEIVAPRAVVRSGFGSEGFPWLATTQGAAHCHWLHMGLVRCRNGRGHKATTRTTRALSGALGRNLAKGK